MLNQNQSEQAVNELSTVFDMLRWCVSQFNEHQVYFGHGTDNAWDEAFALILFALHLPYEGGKDLYPAKLTRREREKVVELVAKRINDKLPLAYLTNEAWYCGLPFFVDERVLVPRSPIAELIEKQFQPWLNADKVERVLDLCTGSGCIAIATAYAFPNADVDAVDISGDALNVAEINIERHQLQEQVVPIQSDVFSELDGQVYDLIVTNPPYVDSEDMESLPEEYHREPELGLAAGVDGLDIVRRILAEASDHLSDNGVLVVEVGNSMVHMSVAYPDVPFTWLQFEKGGDGVFLLTKQELVKYLDIFKQAVL